MQFTPAIEALRLRHAEALLEEVKDRLQPGMAPDALEFSQWLSSRMYDDVRKLAHAARLERDAEAQS